MPDAIQMDMARREKFKKFIDDRINQLEEETPEELKKLETARTREHAFSEEGTEGARTSRRQAMADMERHSERLESLFRELAALEGSLERRAARHWRIAQFVMSGGVGAVVTMLLRRFLLA
jgi:hypothetical protein